MWREENGKGVVKTGWLAELKNGTSAVEYDGVPWAQVKDDVVLLAIVRNDKVLVSLPKGQKRYMQGKTGSCSINGGEITVERRWIGFEAESGEVVKAFISEKTGSVNLTISKGE